MTNKPTDTPDRTLSSLALWTVASNAAYLVPMGYACRMQEWLRAVLLLGLLVASIGHHYVTEAHYDETLWTVADHILSCVTAVALATAWPLRRNQWPLAAGVNVCNAVAVGCVAGDTLKEGCVAGTFVIVSFVLGARRVRLVLRHTSKALLGLVAATVAVAGVVMFAYNFGDTLLHGFWHLDTALLFVLLLKTGTGIQADEDTATLSGQLGGAHVASA